MDPLSQSESIMTSIDEDGMEALISQWNCLAQVSEFDDVPQFVVFDCDPWMLK